MTEERREWAVRGHEDEEAGERARHVVGRVGTALRTHCDRFDGARVHNGSVVFGAAHAGHLLSAVVGRDARSGDLACRLTVTGNGGARWAAVVFPIAMFLTLIASAKIVGGAPGLLGGAALGLVVGAVAAFGAYTFAPRWGLDRGGRGRAVAVAQTIEQALRPSLEHMGLELAASEALSFDGIDSGSSPPVAPEWKASLDAAVAALAT